MKTSHRDPNPQLGWHRKTIVGMVLVLLLFFSVSNFVLLKNERTVYLKNFTDHFTFELEEAAAFMVEPLLKHQFADVDSFIQQWAMSHKDVIRFEAISPKGHVFSTFSRKSASPYELSLTKEVSFEGQHLLTLSMTKDYAEIEELLSTSKNILLGTSFLIVSVLGIGLWIVLRMLAIKPLEDEIAKRSQAERELEEVNDNLDEIIAQRTGELYEKNRLLEEEIQQRKAAEDCLASQKEQLAVTLRSIGDGVITTDISGAITLMNTVAETLTGWQMAEAVGRNFSDVFRVINEQTGELGESPVEQVLTSGQHVTLAQSSALIARNGDEKSIADSGAPIHDAENRMIGVVVVFRDVTEQRMLEKNLLTSQKMESIGTLAGGIAHDFNNILTAIIGYANLALMRQGGNEDKAWHDDLAQVLKAADRATDLVRQILTFSRKQQQEKAPLQLSLIVKESLRLLRAAIPTTIEIRQEINSDAAVMADPTQMHQVIMNLCTNAFHAMQDRGGVLGVTLSETTVAHERDGHNFELTPGEYVQLSISDTGCGMDKAIIDKIFDPYFTTKEQGKGTGLGLAVVHGIVKSHDGRIAVYSEPGQGTTFTVYLPKIIHEAVPELVEVAPPRAKAQERIMVVDDESTIRDLTNEFLVQAGYRVVTFMNGREAWLALSQAPDDWDLLLTDQTMPEMTGDQLAAKALALRPDLPVIICSGYNEIVLVDQAKKAGVFAYLQKPVGLNVLLSQVAKALEQKRIFESEGRQE